MANGERAFHLASLVNNLTEEITIFTSGEKEFSIDQNEKLLKHGIEVVENDIMEIVLNNFSF